MNIIPAINCQNFECVSEKLKKAGDFFSQSGGWIQIDIADGKFTDWKTWNNPGELSDAKNQLPDVNIEVHLMVEHPEEAIDDWIKTGIQRIIVHFEAIRKFVN